MTLSVYNALGQTVATRLQEVQEAGCHDVKFDGSGMASGVYYSRLSCDGNVQLKHMVMIK